MDYRIEHDTMGEVRVPANHYWGAQTQRSHENFPIGTEKIPEEVISAFAVLKKAAALANCKLGNLDERRPATRFWRADWRTNSRLLSGRRAAARRAT